MSDQIFLREPGKSFFEASFSLACKADFDLDFAERLLGRKVGKGLSRRTIKTISRQKERLSELIRPKITWKNFALASAEQEGVVLKNGAHFKSRKMGKILSDAAWVVGFMGTIGGKIDGEIDNLIKKGAVSGGYVADALGSAAVEGLVERFHYRVAREAAKQNKTVGLRFSPGYCDWPVTEQMKLFPLLDHESVGVKLEKSCLMRPRKSISGVFGVFESEDVHFEIKKHNPCRTCGKKDCIARRVDAVPPVF